MSKSLYKVVITGPESTGKSTLTEQLASHYHTVFIPEYARQYVENLNRPYNFDDIEHIARRQVEEAQLFIPKASKFLFFDTDLILTKVWFEVVYKKCPLWVIDAIEKSDIDLFLLCQTDLPWIPDGVRQNGGIMREKLFATYEKEIAYFGFSYRIVSGLNEDRLKNAISFIDEARGGNRE